MEAQFKHGDPVMVDHTPSSAISAGDVVVIEDTPHIAHRDIAVDELSALAIAGGVYELVADGAIDAGVDVFWDATAGKVTLTASGNPHLGISASSAAQDTDPILVYHQPEADTPA